MLYDGFTNSHYCTVEYNAGDAHYAAARELAIAITDRLRSALRQARTDQVQADREPNHEVKTLIAEQAWDQVIALQDLINRNPNAVNYIAEAGLEDLLTAKEPGA